MFKKLPEDHQKRNKTQFWIQIAILLFPVIIYSNTIGHDYALDDAMVITDNQFTQEGLHGLKDIFTNDSFTGFYKEKKVNLPGGRYRPLSIATFAVENSIFGNNPHISHLFNILLFALTGLILYCTLRLLFPEKDKPGYFITIPLLATIIFLVHPIHTEVVTNIKGRDEILSLFFALLSLISAVKYADKKQWYWLPAGFLSLFMALLSKENAITFILIIPLTLYFFRSISLKKLLILLVPFLIAATFYLIIRSAVTGSDQPAGQLILMNNPFLNATIDQKYATIFLTLGIYLKLLFWPHPLTFDYYPNHIELTSFLNIWVLITLVIYISIFIYICFKFLKKNLLVYCFLFFLISLFPVSNLVVNVGTFMNERFVYQASVAFSIGIAWLLIYIMDIQAIRKVFQFKYMKVLVLLAIILTFSVITFSRNFAWKNDYSLFLTDVKTSSNSAKSNCGAGGVLLESALKTANPGKKRDELTLAVQYLKNATSIDPSYADVWRKLGTASYELNHDINTSFIYFCNAIRNNPGDENSYSNIHFLLSKCENVDNKIEYYIELLKINPSRGDVNNLLGYLYGKEKHDYNIAIFYYKQSLNINLNNKEALKGLGMVYLSIGSYEESLHSLQKALKLDSTDAGTYLLMGKVSLKMDDKVKAETYFSNADRLKKD